MKKPLVVFGIGDAAQLAHYYFTSDSDYQVVAFTVDAAYLTSPVFCDLPVISFEDLPTLYPSSHNQIFIALGYSGLNALRKEKYLRAKELGYRCASYISSRATVLNQGRIGDNCFLLEDNTVQPFVTIGDNVTLWSGNHIGHHSTIRDHCFITSQVVISGGVEVGEQSFLGVNSTLRDHIIVGARCVVGAGALILTSLECDGVYIGEATPRSKVPSSRLRRL